MTSNLNLWMQQLMNRMKQITQPKNRSEILKKSNDPNHKREFIVIGLGRFGTSLAMTLDAFGHDVLSVDTDMKRVQTVGQRLPHVIQIDATDIDALREVGAELFDTAIICIGSDFESNLLAAVNLRKLGARRVVAKARTVTQQEILLRVGVDEVVLPEHEAGVRLGRRLSAINFVDFMELSDDMAVVEVITPPQFAGKNLRDTEIRKQFGLTVVAIKRGEQVVVSPRADEIMNPEDILVILGKTADCERFR
jgi:trk system potassium uptake protein TrkA